MRIALITAVFFCSFLLASTGCKKGGGPPPDPGMDSGVDASADASADAEVDAAVDAAIDASMDATVDAATDAGDDGGMCPPGLEPCPTGCVDLDTDDANCGACGFACDAPAECAGGVCL